MKNDMRILNHQPHGDFPRALMFHRVLPQVNISSPNAYWDRGTLVSLDKFRAVLDALEQEGIEAVTLRGWRELSADDRSNKCILTFDDGYQDILDHVFPELQARGLKGVFFPVLGCCETGQALPLDRYYSALDLVGPPSGNRMDWIKGEQKQRFLNADERGMQAMIQEIMGAGHPSVPLTGLYMRPEGLKLLHESGHEIGGHTRWHTLLHGLTAAEVSGILEENLADLRTLTGLSEFCFAWPNGAFDNPALSAIMSTGFYAAFGVGGRLDSMEDRFRIPRYFCKPDMDVKRLIEWCRKPFWPT